MIPSDVANNLRLLAPDLKSATQAQTQPVIAAQRIADVLGDLVPGQRLLAEIQALLPNGTYRAIVAQRDITLALPFSAKPGDSLELEVVDSNGTVSLAVVARKTAGQADGSHNDSVTTTLSNTGKMIGNLLAGIDDQGKRAAPAPLNGNQPLTESFPSKASDLAPILKDALGKSGVFYEAHQARWVAGQLPTLQLLQEPQGQHSQPSASSAPNILGQLPGTPDIAELTPGTAAHSADTASLIAKMPDAGQTPGSVSASAESASRTSSQLPANLPSGGLPADLTPIVQQQLDALATQTFAWQGQVWPGQQMYWEIDEQADGSKAGSDETPGQWQTRLKLNLPRMGGIEATLFLHPGNEVRISIATDSDGSESQLSAAAEQLRQQFEAAGLKLSSLKVKHGATTD